MSLLLYFLDKFYSLISYNLMQEPNKIIIMAKLQTELNQIHVYQVDLTFSFGFWRSAVLSFQQVQPFHLTYIFLH